MISHTVTYEDYNGNSVTETFYFHLSKPELIELEVEVDGGLGKKLQKIVEEKNMKEIIKHFKEILLLGVGIKSENGRRFVKNDEIRNDFVQSPAYEDLYMRLITSEEYAATFIKEMLPKDIASGLPAPATET